LLKFLSNNKVPEAIALQKTFNKKLPSEIHEKVVKTRNCDGCGVKLQFFEPKGLGYVDYSIYKTFIENEINFEQNKKKEVESLASDKALLNLHAKLPTKKELRVIE
jgi:hypothetical protein